MIIFLKLFLISLSMRSLPTPIGGGNLKRKLPLHPLEGEGVLAIKILPGDGLDFRRDFAT
jgi:hypothetical protein